MYTDGNRYEGQMKNNMKNGQGVLTWSDGRKYTGGYTDDKMNGEGEFIWADGRSYKGTSLLIFFPSAIISIFSILLLFFSFKVSSFWFNFPLQART